MSVAEPLTVHIEHDGGPTTDTASHAGLVGSASSPSLVRAEVRESVLQREPFAFAVVEVDPDGGQPAVLADTVYGPGPEGAVADDGPLGQPSRNLA